MIDDDLINRESLAFETFATVPRKEDLLVESIDARQRKRSFKRKLSEAPDNVVLTHNDADGLSAAAMVFHRHNAEKSIVDTVKHHGSFILSDALQAIEEHSYIPKRVYITDFHFEDDYKAIDILRNEDREYRVVCYDHHQWENLTLFDDVDMAKLTVDTDECATSLILQDTSLDYPERLIELSEVTKDHDLWIKEDSRSDRLSVFSKIVDEPEHYVYTVLERGVDFPQDIQERIDNKLEEESRLVEVGVKNAVYEDVLGFEVAFTYLGKGPSSQVGNDLCENGHADIAIIQKAHGGGGIYSHSEAGDFEKCHEVAGELGGGGHPTASGYGHTFEDFDELLDYWRTEGYSKRNEIFEALENVID